MPKKAHRYWVYILCNEGGTHLYTGVTNALDIRTLQHGSNTGSAFTSQHHAHHLVYYEEFKYVLNAIKREKQIKAGSRADKIALINNFNPEWSDLTNEASAATRQRSERCHCEGRSDAASPRSTDSRCLATK